jgi:hypothetical protein
MQDRYAGDIGDFGKFYLLRKLKHSDDRIGVVWYAYPDEGHNNDGLHIGYLCDKCYQTLDKSLIEGLHTVVTKDLCNRSIEKIEHQNLLPLDTKYFSKKLPNSPYSNPEREKWLENALDAMSECNIIFLDPDNGLEVQSVKKGSGKAGKYLYYDEVVAFMKGKPIKTRSPEICIIYHHLCRQGTHKEQILQRMNELRKKLGQEGFSDLTIFSATFRPFSPRSFFIVTVEEKAAVIEKRLRKMFKEIMTLYKTCKGSMPWYFDKMDQVGNFQENIFVRT